MILRKVLWISRFADLNLHVFQVIKHHVKALLGLLLHMIVTTIK